MRDHGGNIDSAIARFGGAAADWIDLSTGINRQAYPLPEMHGDIWQALPTQSALARLIEAAHACYKTQAAVLPVAGAQAAIQMIPRLSASGEARVLGPTYNEHAAALTAAGWDVVQVLTLDALAGADLAVVVNPNNPDGRRARPEALLGLAKRVGRLIVDESFADPEPWLSLAPHLPVPNSLVLRSFGKFYGLAGLRLGFALGGEEEITQLASLAGPWPVSGPAIEVGARALGDHAWAQETCKRLARDSARLDILAKEVGWRFVGGTALFRTYETPDAKAAQDELARGQIWSRIFPYSKTWIRLGLPGDEQEFDRLSKLLTS